MRLYCNFKGGLIARLGGVIVGWGEFVIFAQC